MGDAPLTMTRLAGLVRDGLVIGGAVSTILSAIAIVLWSGFSPRLWAMVGRELGLANLATVENVTRVQDGLQQLRADVQRIAGEDRVLQILPGRSFVREPVYVGDTATGVFFMRRTEAGASCIYIQGIAVFEDETGARLSGSMLPPQRQLTTETSRMIIEFDLPAALQPGRIVMHMELQYRCAGAVRFERTDPLIFRLLEREEQ
ncbi:hypothetical protein [Pukyongiella litopenaei]|uniref:Uncharacterized protein n=1 Tax=Pukyongiella litopenaei TaxID=2605946 RepID=A0A2S0ML42_9RHOB|nr:hypothetical protein [Pukyongiella litopenaei]AVO36586.2 hypothetical protein C6Y53_01975 [Pukyongiella litopenaei]